MTTFFIRKKDFTKCIIRIENFINFFIRKENLTKFSIRNENFIKFFVNIEIFTKIHLRKEHFSKIFIKIENFLKNYIKKKIFENLKFCFSKYSIFIGKLSILWKIKKKLYLIKNFLSVLKMLETFRYIINSLVYKPAISVQAKLEQ